jgi:hypothetical protein
LGEYLAELDGDVVRLFDLMLARSRNLVTGRDLLMALKGADLAVHRTNRYHHKAAHPGRRVTDRQSDHSGVESVVQQIVRSPRSVFE